MLRIGVVKTGRNGRLYPKTGRIVLLWMRRPAFGHTPLAHVTARVRILVSEEGEWIPHQGRGDHVSC
jgi:hypothetical protein